MSAPSPWYRRTKNGLEIFVRLTPRASKDAIEGVSEGADEQRHLKIRVRAVPESGKANQALEKLMAKALGVAQRDVTVVAGSTSRLKTIAVTGDAAASLSLLEKLASWERP
ncbi:DUF167 family protein [Chelativorans sp. Marseille-P2723]|uniref:DUF167 family protein n=1 Tax=Chelativorans sp. Marseille-P2723 TaxID=2709133 RepID=UPI0015704664|nr:DUF167 family protein [Chelativorans sp. Marseille-P2723]